jgi:glutaredoxin 3
LECIQVLDVCREFFAEMHYLFVINLFVLNLNALRLFCWFKFGLIFFFTMIPFRDSHGIHWIHLSPVLVWRDVCHNQKENMGGSESTAKEVTGVLSPELKTIVSGSDVVVFSGSMCPYCTKAKSLLNDKGVPFTEVDVTSAYRNALYEATSQTSVPSIWVKGTYIGGCNDGPEEWMGLSKCLRSGKFEELMSKTEN